MRRHRWGCCRVSRFGSRDKTFSYGLFVPPAHDPEVALPLVVCLHGAGFTGDSYLERWATRLGEWSILACPTTMAGTWWTRPSEELVLATIEAVRARYRIDPRSHLPDGHVERRHRRVDYRDASRAAVCRGGADGERHR